MISSDCNPSTRGACGVLFRMDRGVEPALPCMPSKRHDGGPARVAGISTPPEWILTSSRYRARFNRAENRQFDAGNVRPWCASGSAHPRVLRARTRRALRRDRRVARPVPSIGACRVLREKRPSNARWLQRLEQLPTYAWPTASATAMPNRLRRKISRRREKRQPG